MLVKIAARFWNSFSVLAFEIDPVKAESFCIAVAPFKIVHQTPGGVAFDWNVVDFDCSQHLVDISFVIEYSLFVTQINFSVWSDKFTDPVLSDPNGFHLWVFLVEPD